MRPKQMIEPKVMAFQSFRIFMHILCVSNHLGCSFSLYLLVDLAKTYENKWSQCLNDQSIKNLQLSEVRNLLMQCYVAQYCNGTSMTQHLLQHGMKLPWPSFYNVTHQQIRWGYCRLLSFFWFFQTYGILIYSFTLNICT